MKHFLVVQPLTYIRAKPNTPLFLPEQAFEGIQWSLLPVWGLRKSPSRPKQNHPELFRFNCWFERRQPRSRILFCLIRCDCIGPSQSQCLFIWRLLLYKEYNRGEKICIYMGSKLWWSAPSADGRSVISTRRLLHGNRPVVNQQWHLEVW